MSSAASHASIGNNSYSQKSIFSVNTAALSSKYGKDMNMASSIVVEDYLAKHIRKAPLYSSIPSRPPKRESPFGSFPEEIKKEKFFDGNAHIKLGRILGPQQKFPEEIFKRRMSTIKAPAFSATKSNAMVSATSVGKNISSSSPNMAISGSKIGGATKPYPSTFDTKGAMSAQLKKKMQSASTTTTTSNIVSNNNDEKKSSLNKRKVIYHTDITKEEIYANDIIRSKPRARYQRARTQPSSRRPSLSSSSPELQCSIYQSVGHYMKHQGKFSKPPSAMMQEHTENKARSTCSLIKPHTAPPRAGAMKVRALNATKFRSYYERSDLPICMKHCAGGNRIQWLIEPSKLDYHIYLPLFFDGLCEIEDPCRFLALQGIIDLLEAAPKKVLSCIPKIILPLKAALDTREVYIVCGAMKVLQHVILADPQVGQALVPYYRQLLPTFNLLKIKNDNRGDRIDFNQRRKLCLGDLISETLELLELTGGPDAFINIKYMIPTYESCLLH